MKEQPLETTHAAERAVCASGLQLGSCRDLTKADVKMSVRRTFQALRIAVNDEFSALDALLRVAATVPRTRRSRCDADISLR